MRYSISSFPLPKSSNLESLRRSEFRFVSYTLVVAHGSCIGSTCGRLYLVFRDRWRSILVENLPSARPLDDERSNFRFDRAITANHRAAHDAAASKEGAITFFFVLTREILTRPRAPSSTECRLWRTNLSIARGERRRRGAPIVRKDRSSGEGPKSIKTLIERAEKTMEPAKAVGMDGLDNRKISWPIAGNPPEHRTSWRRNFPSGLPFYEDGEENSRHETRYQQRRAGGRTNGRKKWRK